MSIVTLIIKGHALLTQERGMFFIKRFLPNPPFLRTQFDRPETMKRRRVSLYHKVQSTYLIIEIHFRRISFTLYLNLFGRREKESFLLHKKGSEKVHCFHFGIGKCPVVPPKKIRFLAPGHKNAHVP